MPKLMMIQPGAAGDIFVCLPIAKYWVDRGYELFWPVQEQHIKQFRNIDYVNVSVTKKHYWEEVALDCLSLCEDQKFDACLNLADCGPHPTAQLPWENFEQVKYRLSEVPFDEKYNLQWTPDEVKEDYVLDKYVGDLDSYAFVHDTSSHNENSVLPEISIPIVRCEDFSPEYNIFDWYKVISSADEIYVTESSIWAFCDGIINDLSENRYILPREKMGNMTTISEHWNRKYL